jgi:hypothetical protein
MLHIQDNLYRFRQIQYFDLVNGQPEARDWNVSAAIYRKRDNLFVQSVFMGRVDETPVAYTNPDCTYDKIATDRIVYSTLMELDPDLYSDPQGYYIVWERCCRNNVITNIKQPWQTGQTFYMEFPPIVKDGAPFINSSPQLFPPLSDYGCVDRLYYVDFRGTDPDGDSLAYKLVTPLNTHTADALPDPTPAPHPFVSWADGIGDDNQIPGNPSLNIDSEGFLRVVPSEEGLFVFSVLCEEYRDGEKIGEVRRDFQLFVLDCPDPGTKPVLKAKAPGSADFSDELALVRLSAADDRCFDFMVLDRDGGERVNLRALPVNFNEDISDILSISQGVIQQAGDTLKFQVCLSECPPTPGVPFAIDIVAYDNTCPLPLMDTIRIMVDLEVPANSPPEFVIPTAPVVNMVEELGSVVTLNLKASDADGDSLTYAVVGNDFELDSLDIDVVPTYNADGTLDLQLRWDTDCAKNAYGAEDEFQFIFYVDDVDKCGIDNRDSVIVNIQLQQAPNASPVVTVNGQSEDGIYTVVLDEPVDWTIEAKDADTDDLVTLRMITADFSATQYDMKFSTTSGTGTASGPFTWSVDCNRIDLDRKDVFAVWFVAEDADYCNIPSGDTVQAIFQVLPPTNRAPVLTENTSSFSRNDTIYLHAGERLNLNLLGEDADGDFVQLSMINGQPVVDRFDASFQAAEGQGMAGTALDWQTDCSALNPNFLPAYYNFTFLLEDFKCLVPLSDTLSATVVVSDRDVNYDFMPPNAFTPNGIDDFNEYFHIPTLPPDNCQSRFEKFVVYNRQGKEIFQSAEKSFQWHGGEFPSGVYFYALIYTHRTWKGTISLLR